MLPYRLAKFPGLLSAMVMVIDALGVNLCGLDAVFSCLCCDRGCCGSVMEKDQGASRSSTTYIYLLEKVLGQNVPDRQCLHLLHIPIDLMAYVAVTILLRK